MTDTPILEQLARAARDAYCRQMIEPLQDWETYGLAWEVAADAILADIERQGFHIEKSIPIEGKVT